MSAQSLSLEQNLTSNLKNDVAKLLSSLQRSTAEQYFCLPSYYTWQQFKTLQDFLTQEGICGIKIFYLDGCIELMITSPDHEIIVSILGALLVFYFIENGIPFIPTGSATLASKEKGSSAEADLSYYLTKPRTEHFAPELAIEVVITSGRVAKLDRYQRFGVQEVWFWQDGRLSLYALQNSQSQPVESSQLLPALDIDLLTQCVNLQDATQAIQKFRIALK